MSRSVMTSVPTVAAMETAYTVPSKTTSQ